MKGYTVERITYDEARPWILKKHYAHRMPGSVVYAFGLFNNKRIDGVVTFGMSPNHNLNSIGNFPMIELNRLIVEDGYRNVASYFIGSAFSLLPKPLGLVSYADEGIGHVGYIYQATNWIYTGKSKGQDLFLMTDGKTLHKRALDQQFNNGTRSKDEIKTKIPATSKHRYFYFLGSKKQKKEMLKALHYPILPYPKGESKRYDASSDFMTQNRLF